MNIAIVGGPATGKTRLMRELLAQRPDLQLTDEPPLLCALHAELPPDAAALRQIAAQHRQAYELTLLTGLDLPAVDGAPCREKMDTLLRATLQQAGIGYGVVYGNGPERLRNALRLISPEAEKPVRWTGPCENCADPDCEHRLFTALQGSKAAAHRPA